jgi:hypothetical protein
MERNPAVSPCGLDQNFGRYIEFVVQVANHVQRQRPFSPHHLVHSRPLADNSDQGSRVFTGLFQTKLDRLYGIWQINGIVLAFLSLD